VGIDIAAGEEHFDSSSHQSYTTHKHAMERAQQYNIPITLHAGEISAESIPIAILEFGATRIGHGYRMSSAMMQLVKDAGVHVEICPTTSVETGGWLYENDYVTNDNASTTTTSNKKNWKNHPAVHMMNYGLDLGLNSDDPAVFDTSLSWQWRIALGKMGLSVEQVKEMTKNAIRAAFCSEDEKESLLCLVEQHTPPYMQPRLLQKHSFSDRVTGHYKVCMENC
jgi:adenosine deaminase